MAIRRTLLNALAAMVTKESSVMVQELTLPCSDGTILAAQRWTCNHNINASNTNTILCLHGWLDNCRSFYHLAPALVAAQNNNCNVVALDLPGHGKSSHKSADAPPMVQAEMVHYVAEAIHALQEESLSSSKGSLTLIGHSLGAGIASLYTAAFPEQIGQLILLDGAGFLAREAKDTALHVRNHVTRRRKQQQQTKKPPRIYPSLEVAIQTRQESTKRMPGQQTLSYEAAKELVQRATRSCDDDGVQFRHDPRFAWPSIQYMTWEQNEGIFQSLRTSQTTDCCILLADDGWPMEAQLLERTKELIEPVSFQSLPGSHYFHADPETADAVVDAIVEFLSSRVDGT
jgi:pimeloyl-ACP methyl ester carboxylesterase